jgi:hypothetical protein
MYNDERQLVPCSIAAPPSSFAANVHRQVTRGHQFAFDLICAALACPSSSPASCACACSCCKCVIANALSGCWGPNSALQRVHMHLDMAAFVGRPSRALPCTLVTDTAMTRAKAVLVMKSFRGLLACASQHSHRIRLHFQCSPPVAACHAQHQSASGNVPSDLIPRRGRSCQA